MSRLQNFVDPETGLKLLRKTLDTRRIYDIVINQNDIREGDNVGAVAYINATALGKVAGSDPLNLTGPTHDNNRTLQVEIWGGTVGEKYRLDYKALTVQGDEIADAVALEVV